MKCAYEPYVIRKLGDGRLFLVNPQMPFEFFLDCFQLEQPCFCVAQLADGRLAITPNPAVIPPGSFQTWFGTQTWLPTETEYVMMRGTYPIIMTAHPITKVEEWLRKFERFVIGFTKQTFADFVCCSHDFIPVKFGKKTTFANAEETVEI